ncbi:unnamed protein product [Blepharisma stoltei]|uniref:USP domain-containing protein n=1 Tax=Blepharisma stoltei TaxID=1481888 RepID=A0AAU9IPN3_9CILI|nr:unnamed protein product [Blepharisma stoltei]
MNYNICSFPSCDGKPKYMCDWQDQKLVFCKLHKKSHSASNSLTHRFEYLYRKPAKPTIISILKSFQEEKSKLQNIKLQFSSEVSTNMKNLEEINKNGLKSLDSGIRIIDKYIRKIITTKEIRTNEEDALLKILLLNDPNDVQIQLESFISEYINYGDIANSCVLSGLNLGNERTVEINSGNNAKIKDLEKNVAELKHEVRRLSQIIENSRQVSRNEEPVASNLNLSRSAYYEPARNYYTFQPENQHLNSSQAYLTVGNGSLFTSMISLLPDQKHGFSDINDNSYLTSALQILASTSLFIELSKSIIDPTLVSLNILFHTMKRSNFQNFVDNLLSDFNITLIQNSYYTNFEKDPKNVINWLINKLYEYYPNQKLFSTILTTRVNCEVGHEHIKLDYINVIEFMNFANKPIHEEIDQNIKTSTWNEDFCSICNQTKLMSNTVESIEVGSFLILELPIGNQYILPEEFNYMGSKYEIYGAIKCLYQIENTKKYAAYTKDGCTWREYLDNNSKIWQPDFSSCYLAFFISS